MRVCTGCSCCVKMKGLVSRTLCFWCSPICMAIVFKISENYFHELRWALSCWQLGGTYGSALIQAKSIAHLQTMRLWSAMSTFDHRFVVSSSSTAKKELQHLYTSQRYIWETNCKVCSHYSNQRARLFVKTWEIKYWTILCAVFSYFPTLRCWGAGSWP